MVPPKKKHADDHRIKAEKTNLEQIHTTGKRNYHKKPQPRDLIINHTRDCMLTGK